MGGREELVDRVVTSSGLYEAGLDWPNRDNLLVGLCCGTEWAVECQFSLLVGSERWAMPTEATSPEVSGWPS